MPDIPHQHENERLLYRTRRPTGALFSLFLASFWQGVIAGVILAVVVNSILTLLFDLESSIIRSGLLIVLPFLLLLWRRFTIFQKTELSITSERIIYHHYPSLLRTKTHTINWGRYQESTYEAGILEQLINTGTLVIHYGTADAAKSLEITRIAWAKDLKHYLDKIQSLKKAQTLDLNLPLFVKAKKGKRDKAVLSY